MSSNEITVGTTDVALVSDEVEAKTNTDVTVLDGGTIEGRKKEYSIVGDALYATINTEQVPQWLNSVIDSALSVQLDSALIDLSAANNNIIRALDELDIAKNEYQQLINIQATVDGAVAAATTTLNATVDQNTANITNLDATKVTADQAIAIAVDQISASINSTTGGTIGASITTINNSIATNSQSISNLTNILETNYNDLSSAQSTLEQTVIANEEEAQARFAYNSTLMINGLYYQSGFGINATGGSADLNNPFNSEFWVKSDTVRFVDSTSSLILEGDAHGLTFPQAGSIKSENYDLLNNAGVFMGWNPDNSDYELMAGDGSSYMRWGNGSLTVKGDIIGSSISGSEISGGTVTGVDIVGANITGSVIKSSWLDFTGTGLLTDWKYFGDTGNTYGYPEVPAAYRDNFAKNPDGSLALDSEGYARLPSSGRVGPVSYLDNSVWYVQHNTGSPGTLTIPAISLNMTAYDDYTVSSPARLATQSANLTFDGWLMRAKIEAGAGGVDHITFNTTIKIGSNNYSIDLVLQEDFDGYITVRENSLTVYNLTLSTRTYPFGSTHTWHPADRPFSFKVTYYTAESSLAFGKGGMYIEVDLNGSYYVEHTRDNGDLISIGTTTVYRSDNDPGYSIQRQIPYTTYSSGII